jgi:hypothetical protein
MNRINKIMTFLKITFYAIAHGTWEYGKANIKWESNNKFKLGYSIEDENYYWWLHIGNYYINAHY